MSYYAPFYTPMTNNYTPNAPNGLVRQNFASQGYINPQSNTSQNESSMIWVLGKNEAESYPVAPNCQVVLWDKNAPTLYVKSVSANGVPNMRTLDFTERTEMMQNSAIISENDLSGKFVAVDDFKALRAEFEDLKAKYSDLSQSINEKSKVTAKKLKGDEA